MAKDPDEVIIILNHLKIDRQIIQKHEAIRKEVSLKAADKGTARQCGK